MSATYPMDMVRGRITVQIEISPYQYRGMFHALTTVLRQEVPRALYKDWLPSVIGVVPYVGLNFAVYESLKDWLIKARPFGLVQDSELSVTTRLACGAAVGTIGQTAAGFENLIGYYEPPVQEIIVIDEVLSAMVGVEGRYISIKTLRGKKDEIINFLVDPSMDLTLQELAKWIFPICRRFLLINQFMESRSQFQNGLVNHAFFSALREFLLDYQAFVAQLEHQFRLGRLSLQGLWFYCQPMLRSMQALSTVIQKASTNNFSVSAILNLLQSQAKAMAGDNAVRLLLEKMTMCK
ncbi:gamma-tubulin complex component 2 [Lathyrus oleraceus]|uniref:gamma-tubulin complex component 2 n=1 Tax=Pisum sativum TaxID=3888 RepID=UPI0021D06833|nr:gamma-tubulin complex component 2-like [Pisum sativum]